MKLNSLSNVHSALQESLSDDIRKAGGKWNENNSSAKESNLSDELKEELTKFIKEYFKHTQVDGFFISPSTKLETGYQEEMSNGHKWVTVPKASYNDILEWLKSEGFKITHAYRFTKYVSL